jgi:DNA-binding transcriptional MerR regulator
MAYSMKYVIEKLGVSANTLRYYETEEILKDIARDTGGRRVYSEENIKWIDFIRSLRLTGMPIVKIKEYVDLYEQGDATFHLRKQMMMEHKLNVQAQINESLKHLDVISYKVAMYEIQEKEFLQKI